MTASRFSFLAALMLAACGSSGAYVWYRDVPKDQWGGSTGQYVIGAGDIISVDVYGQEAMRTRMRVRTDGRIAIQFIGEVTAAGKPPAVLSQEIEARLKEFVVAPRVTVSVEEAHSVVISVLGEVGTVGTLTLEPGAGLLQALAQAGGPSAFADRSAIYVLRRQPQFKRIRFTYEALIQNTDGAATFPLQTGDVIVVE